MRISTAQTQALAAFITRVRPDWDHPGIVAEISASLAARGVSIEELSTDVREAPMAGGWLFEASALLDAPPNTSIEALQSVLEQLADELMVEIRLSKQ